MIKNFFNRTMDVLRKNVSLRVFFGVLFLGFFVFFGITTVALLYFVSGKWALVSLATAIFMLALGAGIIAYDN